MALAGSMLLSADNGHAAHPNFGEKSDPANKVYPNGGVVVKYSANQKYTTNALTAGVFKAICQKAGVPCYLNSFPQAGTELGHPYLQFSFPLLTEFGRPQGIQQLGVSVHSVEQAVRAQQLGADFLIAGHIFPTDCKPGLPPRGLEFLGQVCRAVSVPVYAIGGITPENAPLAVKAGAAGVCIMSGTMKL